MGSKYKKGGSAGIKGVDFQIGLLTIFALNALRKHQDWKLSTENKEAGKFDDIVFEFTDKSAVLLQAKFKEFKKITFEQLLSVNSKKDDFSLPKYFFSFLYIKTNFIIKDIIICTNTHVEQSCLKFLKLHNMCSESMLYHEYSSCLCYTFNNDILPYLKEKINIYYTNNLQGKCSDEAITNENIKDFLKSVRIYCNYPSGDDVGKVIEKLLLCLKQSNNSWCNASPQEVLGKVKSWFQQPHGEYLTEIRVKAIFCDIKCDKYCETLDSYDVLFEHNDFTFPDYRRIFHVIVEGDYLLQMIQIYQSLQKNKTKVLYVCPEDDIYVQNQVIEVFELPKYTHLIIIQPKIADKYNTNRLCGKLRDILEKFRYKKIILVSESNNNSLIQQIGKDNYFDVISESVKFENFAKVTQEKLLRKKNIIFQGSDVSLEELFSDQTINNLKAVNSNIIEKIVKDEKINVGSEIRPLDDNISCCYIDRRFTRNTMKSECDDIEKNITNQIYSEEDICNLNEKVIVISDSAGMGKSTVLTKLAEDIKLKNPHMWVIKIDLNDYCKVLKEFLINNRKSSNVMELLIFNSKSKNHLEEFVFSMHRKVVLMLDGVDEISPDYTEIILSMLSECQKASNFAKIFVTTRPHIAQQLEKRLRVNYFSLQSFTEENQIKFLTNYWARQLNLHDMNIEKCKQFAKALIKKFMSWIKLCHLGEDYFSAIPLQVRMLADIFQQRNLAKGTTAWDGCKEYLNSDKIEPKLPEKISIAELYNMFMEKKRCIFLDKENPSGGTAANQALVNQYDVCLTYHRILALEAILSTEECKLFSCYQEVTKHIDTNTLKIGIVQKYGTHFHFVHRTFAEYFVAECLLKELQYPNQNGKFQMFFIDEVLCKHKFNIIRVFFNSFLQKVLSDIPSNTFKKYRSLKCDIDLEKSSKLIHYLSLEGCGAIIQLILKCIGFKIVKGRESHIKDIQTGVFRRTFGKYILRNTLNILRFLTRRGGINIKDDQGIIPLHYAMLSKDLETKKLLVDLGGNIQSKDWNNRAAYKVAIIKNDIDILAHFLESMLKNDNLNINSSPIPYIAAYLGRIDVLKTVIEKGVDVNSKIGRRECLVLGAVRGGHLEVIKFLVEKGVDLNSKNENDASALHVAAAIGNLNIIKYLVDLGAKTDAKYVCSWTALHTAAYNGNLETIGYLVESGEDINIRNNAGNTVLHLAASRRRSNVVKYLVSLGANINIKNYNGFTALHAATAYLSNSHIVRCLLELGADANITDNNGNTPLHLCVKSGELNSIKYIVEFGADANIANKEGCTPLHLAIGNSMIVKYLLEAGVETDIKNNNGSTALHVATKNSNLNNIAELKKFGANVDIKNNEGSTALHLAIGNSKIVKCLLEFGINTDAKDNNGLTGLHLAAKNSDVNSIKYLVEFNANTNDGNNALHLAVINNKFSSIKNLIEMGVDSNALDSNGNTALHLAASLMDLNIVKYLTELHVDMNIKNYNGCTPLHVAAERNNLNIVKYLVQFGADINMKDNGGRTGLHLAVMNNKFYNMQYLVESGADINATDYNGLTLLHLAVFGQKKAKIFEELDVNKNVGEKTVNLLSNKSDLYMLKFLIELSVDVNIRDNDGRTVLHYAALEGSKVVKFLIKKGADITIKDRNGDTACTLAKGKGYLHLLKYLDPTLKNKKFLI